MNKATRTGSVHNEPGMKRDEPAILLTVQCNAIATWRQCRQLDLIDVINAETLRLIHQKRIEIGAIPVRICNSVMWTCCNQQLPSVVWIWCVSFAEHMVIKSEAPLESTSN